MMILNISVGCSLLLCSALFINWIKIFTVTRRTAHSHLSLATLLYDVRINIYLSLEGAARPLKPSAMAKNHLESTCSLSPGAFSLVSAEISCVVVSVR